MTTTIDIDLETGDLTEFTATSTNGGELSVAAGAARHGSFGLQCVINTTDKYARVESITKNSSGLRYRLYIKPSVTMADGDQFTVAKWTQNAGSYSNQALLYFRRVGANLNLRFQGRNDAGTAAIDDNLNVTNDVWICVEIKVVCASTSSSSDGAYEWWVDGVSQGSVSGVDNYNLWQDQNWRFLVVAESADAGTSGYFYWDSIIATDTPNTEIGPVVTALPIRLTRPNQQWRKYR